MTIRTNPYRKGTQKYQILNYLLDGHRLSSVDALAWWSIARLASRVDELRKGGWPVKTHMKRVGKKQFASYRMEPGCATGSRK